MIFIDIIKHFPMKCGKLIVRTLRNVDGLKIKGSKHVGIQICMEIEGRRVGKNCIQHAVVRICQIVGGHIVVRELDGYGTAGGNVDMGRVVTCLNPVKECNGYWHEFR